MLRCSVALLAGAFALGCNHDNDRPMTADDAATSPGSSVTTEQVPDSTGSVPPNTNISGNGTEGTNGTDRSNGSTSGTPGSMPTGGTTPGSSTPGQSTSPQGSAH